MQLLDSRNQIPFLLQLLNLNGVGVEVGVAYGDFSNIILQYSNLRKLYSVDPWSSNLPGFEDKEQAKLAHNKTIEKLAKYGDRSVIIKAQIENIKIVEQLDFIYIDSSHSYEDTKNQIAMLWPKLRVGGIIAGHDYINGIPIQKAVGEFAGSIGKQIFTTRDDYSIPNLVVNSWIIRK